MAALKNSPALAALQSGLQAAQSAFDRDRDGDWPALTLTDEQGYDRFVTGFGMIPGPENLATAEFALDLKRLLAPPERVSRLDIERGRLLLARSRGEVARNVRSKYDHLLVLKQAAADRAGAVAFMNAHIRDIERQGDSGLDVALDLVRARGQRRALDLTSATDEGAAQDALATLQSLTGLDLSIADLEGGPPAEAGQGSPASASASLSTTVESRLNGLDLESATLAYRQSGWPASPELRFGVAHSFQNTDPTVPLDQIYGQLSLVAFDWGATERDAQRLRLQREAQNSETLEKARDLRLRAELLDNGVRHARRVYSISVDLVRQDQQGLKIAQTYYRQGKIKEGDLLAVFSDYLTALGQKNDALLALLDSLSAQKALWDGVGQ